MKRIGVCIVMLLLGFPLAAQTKYVVNDLGTMGGDFPEVQSINNFGQVTGTRTSVAQPGFTLIAVFSFALGIGREFVPDRCASARRPLWQQHDRRLPEGSPLS